MIYKLEEKKFAKNPKTGYPLKMTLPGNKYVVECDKATYYSYFTYTILKLKSLFFHRN